MALSCYVTTAHMLSASTRLGTASGVAKPKQHEQCRSTHARNTARERWLDPTRRTIRLGRRVAEYPRPTCRGKLNSARLGGSSENLFYLAAYLPYGESR